MNTAVMRLWHTLVLLDFVKDVWMLPPPSTVTMESVDMRHMLTWRPLQDTCNTTILYSVQFQGEFELTVLNDSWVDAPDCQQIPHTHCDLTLDLGSDSDYNLHVRAQCGAQLSAWSQLSPPFNRRDTVMMAPKMTVTTSGNVLSATFDKLPLTAVTHVTVWKEGGELEPSVHTVPAEQTVLHVANLQSGVKYCVRAHIVLNAQLQSSHTDVQCVSITAPAGQQVAWKRPTTVTVTVIIMAVLLFAAFWFMVHCSPETCQKYFHKETLPHSLQHVQNFQIQLSLEEEEEEFYEQIHMLPDVYQKH